MQTRDARYQCRREELRFPICATLLTESSEEKTRHPAIPLALSETGGTFSSDHQVVPGETIGVILHPELRYAIRGCVTWAHRMPNQIQFEFGIAFEEKIPDSLREILGQLEAA
jgi:hypothetical protein